MKWLSTFKTHSLLFSCSLPGQIKSHHLDFTKQTAKSLPLDNWCSEGLLISTTYLISVDVSCGHARDVTLFKKGQIIGLYQGKNKTKEMLKLLKVDNHEPSSSRKKCDREKSWMIVIGDHWNLWWNQIVKNPQSNPRLCWIVVWFATHFPLYYCVTCEFLQRGINKGTS